MNHKTFFRGKNIAVIGLGPHGEMVADIKFLLRSGAKVSFFDLRSEARLGGHLANIASGLVSYSVGKIPGDELLSAELIILSPDIPKKSLFLKKARQAGIRIEYPEILFLKMVPPITLVGVMGASGKSTVSHMLYSVLKPAFAEYDDQGLFFIDPHLPHGALTHLKKIKQGDVVLSRIPEDVMGEYHEARLSPYVAVVTSLTSAALAGMKKAFAILEFQTHNNFVVASDEVIDALKTRMELPLKAKMLRVKPDNKALVIQTAELFKVTADSIQKTLETFTGLKSHLELVKKIDGVEYYNDSASTNPVSTLFGLRKLGHGQNIVLIMGGAYTTFDYSNLLKSLPTYVRSVILLPGSGSLGIRAELEKIPDIRFFQSPTLEEAVILAKGEAKRGDVVLFSPGFEAVGVHVSRRDRGEKFVKAVRGL